MPPMEVPCTITLGADLLVDVEAAEEPRQLTLRGTPGYADIDTSTDPDDPDDEAFIPPPVLFGLETQFGPLECELDTSTDGLVTLSMTTHFDNPGDDALAAALDAYRDVYEVWELVLLDEPPSHGEQSHAPNFPMAVA